MNTGIQDAINLGWKMAWVYRGLAPDALLDTYDEERLPVIHQLVKGTERATDIVNSDRAFVHTLLRHMLPPVLHIDAVRRRGAEAISELAVHYRTSSLNGTSESHGTLHAGDRFPDVATGGEDSERMLDLLDPSRFTVLAAGAPLRLDAYGDLCVQRHVTAPGSALRAALGDATVAVIRPDAYLLCAGSRQAVQARLDAWAGRWLII
jgi:hypothetical protein